MALRSELARFAALDATLIACIDMFKPRVKIAEVRDSGREGQNSRYQPLSIALGVERDAYLNPKALRWTAAILCALESDGANMQAVYHRQIFIVY